MTYNDPWLDSVARAHAALEAMPEDAAKQCLADIDAVDSAGYDHALIARLRDRVRHFGGVPWDTWAPALPPDVDIEAGLAAHHFGDAQACERIADDLMRHRWCAL